MKIYVNYYLGEAISLSDKIIVLTKRPALVKDIYNIKFKDNLLPDERRRDNLFNKYYDIIWKEIDHNV